VFIRQDQPEVLQIIAETAWQEPVVVVCACGGNLEEPAFMPSFPRKRESRLLLRVIKMDDQLRCCEALPAFAGMTA
jgi:hypothetical protein